MDFHEWFMKTPSHVLAAFLYPFVMALLTLLVLYPARVATRRFMKDGRLKRILLFQTNATDSYKPLWQAAKRRAARLLQAPLRRQQ